MTELLMSQHVGNILSKYIFQEAFLILEIKTFYVRSYKNRKLIKKHTSIREMLSALIYK